MSYTYIYSMATDFEEGLNPGLFSAEIEASSISGSIEIINRMSDVVNVTFDSQLDAPDEVTLSGVVEAHVFIDNTALDEFLGLNDTPNNYVTAGDLYLKVKNDISGVEFYPADATYIRNTIVDETDIQEGYILRYDAVEDHLHYENIGAIIEEFGIFGSRVTVTGSESTSSTTSTTFQEKLTTTIPDLPYGVYRVGWYYQWQIANSNFKFFGQIQQDDDEIIMMHEERPSNAGTWTAQSGFYYLTTSGTLKLDLDFATESTGKLCSIRNTRLEFWRVE